MREEDLLKAIGEADEEMVLRAKMPLKPNRRRTAVVKWAAVAACLCIVLFGARAIGAEAEEMKEAVRFFDENGLSTEGLTRGEIKEVYRDIATDSFTNRKTAEVIANSTAPKGLTTGFEISQEMPSPEDAKQIWELVWSGKKNQGIHYECGAEYREDPNPDDVHWGEELFEKSYFEKYNGEELLWRVEFKQFYVSGWSFLGEDILIKGHTPVWSPTQKISAWLARVSADGTVLWERIMRHEMKFENVCEVADNGDGTFAVISYGYNREGSSCYMCQYDAFGNELSMKKIPVGTGGAIKKMAKLGEEYIVVFRNLVRRAEIWADGTGSSDTEPEEPVLGQREYLVKLDKDGNFSEEILHFSGEYDYYFTDLVEFDGKLYLSANSVPNQGDYAYREEIGLLVRQIFEERKAVEISNEEMLDRLREYYTAVLLVCDAQTGTPETFYTVPGCMGSRLEAGDNLVWNVEVFRGAVFSPATNSFTIGGTCQVYRYTFGDSGKLLLREKTEEIKRFYK